MKHRRARVKKSSDEPLAVYAIADLVPVQKRQLDPKLLGLSSKLLDSPHVNRMERNLEVTGSLELAVEAFFSSKLVDPIDAPTVSS